MALSFRRGLKGSEDPASRYLGMGSPHFYLVFGEEYDNEVLRTLRVRNFHTANKSTTTTIRISEYIYIYIYTHTYTLKIPEL